MGSFLQISVGLEVSTLIEKFPAAVFHLKRNPALIEISLFRNKGVTDFSVLDHHACSHRLPRRKTEGFAAKWRDQLRLATDRVFFFDREKIDGYRVFQEFLHFLKLIVITVNQGNRCIRAQKSVRHDLPRFRTIIARTLRQRHVTSLTGKNFIFFVKREWGFS